MAYTEMFFIDKLWPEVTHQDLRLVLRQFYERRRRFGV
jgi:undecaprenyl diphosphate synthase